MALRPKYFPLDKDAYSKGIRDAIGAQNLTQIRKSVKNCEHLQISGEREVNFLDIITQAINCGEKTQAIVELIKLMRNEVQQSKG